MPIGSRTIEADEEEAVEPKDVVVSRLSTLAAPSCGAWTCCKFFGPSLGKLSGKRSELASRSALARSRSTISMTFQLRQTYSGRISASCNSGWK